MHVDRVGVGRELAAFGGPLPFWLSVVVGVAGYVIRRRLAETPLFEEEVAQGTVPRMPLALLFRHHWRSVLRVACAALIASVSTIFTVWALNYATSDSVGLDRGAMLWVGVLANAVALLAIPLWARLPDQVGRKPIFLVGAIGSPLAVFAYLAAINSGNYVLVFLSGIACLGVVYSAANGIWPSLYGEMFTTKVRLSGMAIGTQIGFGLSGLAVTSMTVIMKPQR